MKHRICLGKITGPHGVKGLVKILPYGDDPYLIEEIEPLYGGEESENTLKIALKNPQKTHFLAKVDGISSREDAEKIAGTELWIDRSHLPELSPEDGYYIEDLKLCTAVDNEGNHLGKVLSVDNYGAGDLLTIQLDKHGQVMIPFVDEYVLDVRLSDKVIAIKDYEGFLP